MEPLHFNEQIKVFASSQILLMTHGAALVNILFMPEVNAAAAIHSDTCMHHCSITLCAAVAETAHWSAALND